MGKKKAPTGSSKKTKLWRPWEDLTAKKKSPKKPPPSQNPHTNVLFEGDVPNVDGLCYLLTRFPGSLKELSVEDVESVLGRGDDQKEEKKSDQIVKPPVGHHLFHHHEYDYNYRNYVNFTNSLWSTYLHDRKGGVYSKSKRGLLKRNKGFSSS